MNTLFSGQETRFRDELACRSTFEGGNNKSGGSYCMVTIAPASSYVELSVLWHGSDRLLTGSLITAPRVHLAERALYRFIR